MEYTQNNKDNINALNFRSVDHAVALEDYQGSHPAVPAGGQSLSSCLCVQVCA